MRKQYRFCEKTGKPKTKQKKLKHIRIRSSPRIGRNSDLLECHNILLTRCLCRVSCPNLLLQIIIKLPISKGDFREKPEIETIKNFSQSNKFLRIKTELSRLCMGATHSLFFRLIPKRSFRKAATGQQKLE